MTIITYFPHTLLLTSPTQDYWSHSTSGIGRVTSGGFVVVGSMYCVDRVLVIVAIASHSLGNDCLKDLQARILLKPFASKPEEPPAPFVLKTACLTISQLISVYTDFGNSSSIGPNEYEFLKRWIHTLVGKLNNRCFWGFPAAIFVPLKGTPTWRPHTKLNKFGKNFFSEYLAYEISHRPDSWRGFLYNFFNLLSFPKFWIFCIERFAFIFLTA